MDKRWRRLRLGLQYIVKVIVYADSEVPSTDTAGQGVFKHWHLNAWNGLWRITDELTLILVVGSEHAGASDASGEQE
jgi:hypothetical protein